MDGRGIHHLLRQAGGMWMTKWQEDGDGYVGEAELLVSMIDFCSICWSSDKLLQFFHPQYKRLTDITNKICYQLRQCQHQHPLLRKDYSKEKCNNTFQTESDMQDLVHLVVCASSDGIDPDIKQTFFTIEKAYYYMVHCMPKTIYFHISKVLF